MRASFRASAFIGLFATTVSCTGSVGDMGTGLPGVDAGQPQHDGGGGGDTDAGPLPGSDAGPVTPPTLDGGTPDGGPGFDAGPRPGDAGTPARDAGTTPPDAGSSNPPDGSVMDFAARCAQPGVVKCVGFDDDSELSHGSGGTSGAWGQNSGLLPVGGTSEYAIRDTTNRASGPSSLRFTIPANASADTSGAYFTNFSSDLSVQFDGNQEFYVQWRQRFSPEFISSQPPGGGGFKQVIVGTGDQPGKVYSSCSSLELVTINYSQQGLPVMYNSCTGSTSHGAYDGFYEPAPPFDFKLQNSRPAPGCLYSQSSSGYFPPSGNCLGYAPNEWMTFQMRVQLGARVGDEFKGSFITLWVAREGQPSEEIIHWGPYNVSAGDPADQERYGKVWLLPYNTGRSSSATNPVGYTWYDELIISRNRIADPGATNGTGGGGTGTDAGTSVADAGASDAGSGPSDAGTSGHGGSDAGEESMPAWRKGFAVGEWHQIPNTALASALIAVKTYPTLGGTGPNSKVIAWVGYSLDRRDSAVYSAANGGHGDYAGNEVDRLRLSDDAPSWAEPRPSSAVADIVQNMNHYKDGRPTARHSYYGEFFNEARNRAMTLGGSRYGNGDMGDGFDGFNVDTNDWDPADTYPNAPSDFSSMQGGSMTSNPTTGDVYSFAHYAVNVWSSAANTWAKKLDTPSSYGQMAASAYDTKRDRILLVGNGEHSVYDVKANTFTTVTLSGPNAGSVNGNDNGMVYDPNLDAYLIRTDAAGGTVYRVDAVSFAVDTFATTGGTGIPATSNGVWTRFLYAPALKGVVYVPSYEGNVWFLRTW